MNGQPPVTPFNPGGFWEWQVPIFEEEIGHQQSSYKGTSGNKTDFTSAQMRQSGGSTSWVFADFQSSSAWDWLSSLSNKGFHDVQSDSWLRIWN